MRSVRRCAGLLGLGLALSAGAGCQTWYGGMTLPSPHYLENHPPQYFPPDPPFPLQRELAAQEEAAGLLRPAGPGVGPLGPAPGGVIAPPPGR